VEVHETGQKWNFGRRDTGSRVSARQGIMFSLSGKKLLLLLLLMMMMMMTMLLDIRPYGLLEFYAFSFLFPRFLRLVLFRHSVVSLSLL